VFARQRRLWVVGGHGRCWRGGHWQGPRHWAVFSTLRSFIARRGGHRAALIALAVVAAAATSHAEDPETIAGKEVSGTTEQRLKSLAQELARTANEHGPDAVTLQAGLLVQTIRAGAVGPSEVSVVGPSRSAGESYLEVDVVTGLIFDSDSTSPRSRLTTMWNDIVAPALEGSERLETIPPNLELVLVYGTQRFSEQVHHKPDPSEPFDSRRLRVEISEAALGDLVAGAISTDELLARSEVFEGNRTIAKLVVSSSAFDAGQTIPRKHTGEGEDVSPALVWSEPPEGTVELALICDDPDAPRAEPWVHWVAYGIDGDTRGLAESVTEGLTGGKNSWGRTGYGGPLPPRGHGVHHYHFKVYALDKKLEAGPGLDKGALLEAMAGHVLAEGELVGTYERK